MSQYTTLQHIMLHCKVSDLHLKALLHLRKDGKLPHRHLAEVQLDVDFLHRLIDWDQIVSEQPELIEENSGVVGHRLEVGVQVSLDLHGMQRNMINMSAYNIASQVSRNHD